MALFPKPSCSTEPAPKGRKGAGKHLSESFSLSSAVLSLLSLSAEQWRGWTNKPTFHLNALICEAGVILSLPADQGFVIVVWASYNDGRVNVQGSDGQMLRHLRCCMALQELLLFSPRLQPHIWQASVSVWTGVSAAWVCGQLMMSSPSKTSLCIGRHRSFAGRLLGIENILR